MTIRAIETRYAGCRFRSRLEARWAVFFDTLGIAWEYEPQGFLIDGVCYLPDFYLPEQKLWVEIKPPRESWLGAEKFLAFATKLEFVGDRAALFQGPIPTEPDRGGLNISVLGDEGYQWCACSTGKHFDVQFAGRNARIKCGCPGYEAGGRWITSTDGDMNLRVAFEAALSARFEHGESG